MSDSKKQNLPSWMSAREDKEQRRSQPKSSASTSVVAHDHDHDHDHDFSKLMQGVVFVLSGFVNPERAELRSRALEMGAEFQTDWNPNCTLLICAFPNTPKFQQVEADSGTIVSKEWISECYNRRKLVDIEPYLLHAGKPWRRPHSVSQVPNQDHEAPSPLKSWEKSFNSLPSSCASSEGKRSNQVSDSFSPSRVKKWATDDLGKTLLWLESQDEKPERGEIKKIAVEGILTCLQDTIYTLEQGQDIQQISEQWACIPRVVEELIKFDGGGKGDWSSVSKEDLCGHAVACKKIYEGEYSNIAGRFVCEDEEAYESDETIEMTEEEIEQAYNTLVSFC